MDIINVRRPSFGDPDYGSEGVLHFCFGVIDGQTYTVVLYVQIIGAVKIIYAV